MKKNYVLICLIMLGSISHAYAENIPAPHWIHHTHSKIQNTREGETLSGNSFLLMLPIQNLGTAYDTRVMLTFKENELIEKSATGTKIWPIKLGSYSFQIPGLYQDTVYDEGSLQRVASNKKHQTTPEELTTQFSVYKAGKNHVNETSVLVKTSYHTYESGKIAYLRKLSDSDADKISDYFEDLQKKSKDEYQKLLKNNSGKPMPEIDLVNSAYGSVLESIYDGRFKDLLGDAKSFSLAALSISSDLKALFHQYHERYYKKYGNTEEKRTNSGKDWEKFQEKLVTVDRYGNKTAADVLVGDPVFVRSKYADSYKNTSLDQTDAVGQLVKLGIAINTRVQDKISVNDFNSTIDAFHKKYMEISPETIKHFEDNLDRLVKGESPVILERKTQVVEIYDLNLPWETEVKDPIRKEYRKFGISYDIPSSWAILKLSLDSAKKHNINFWQSLIEKTKKSYKERIVIRSQGVSFSDFSQNVTNWLDLDNSSTSYRDGIVLPPLTAEEVKITDIVIDGKNAKYFELRRIHVAIVNDGQQEWTFSITSLHSALGVPSNDVFHTFLKSIKFQPADKDFIEEQQNHDTKRFQGRYSIESISQNKSRLNGIEDTIEHDASVPSASRGSIAKRGAPSKTNGIMTDEEKQLEAQKKFNQQLFRR